MDITSSSRSSFWIGIKAIIPITGRRGSRCKKERIIFLPWKKRNQKGDS
jgi:hypothetical protein